MKIGIFFFLGSVFTEVLGSGSFLEPWLEFYQRIKTWIAWHLNIYHPTLQMRTLRHKKSCDLVTGFSKAKQTCNLDQLVKVSNVSTIRELHPFVQWPCVTNGMLLIVGYVLESSSLVSWNLNSLSFKAWSLARTTLLFLVEKAALLPVATIASTWTDPVFAIPNLIFLFIPNLDP